MIPGLIEAYYAANLIKLGREFLGSFGQAPSVEEAQKLKLDAYKMAEHQLLSTSVDDTNLNSVTKTLIRRIEGVQKEIEKCYNNPAQFQSEMELNGAVLQRKLCSFISETKRHNGGKVPEIIAHIWEESCCTNGIPIFE